MSVSNSKGKVYNYMVFWMPYLLLNLLIWENYFQHIQLMIFINIFK